MKATALGKLFRGRNLTFICTFVGSEDVNMGAADLRAECAQVLKKCVARKKSSLWWLRKSGSVIIQIRSENIRIVGDQIAPYQHPIKIISSITRDADDETLFGYVCSQPCSTGYKLHTFQSGEAENVIKILNEALEVANNSRKEAESSMECPDNFSQEINAIIKVKETKAELLGELLRGGDLTFKCTFVGSEDVNVEAADMRAECAQARKKSSLWWLRKSGSIILQIQSENIRIVGDQIAPYQHPIKIISSITRDADDETVFGYVCSQPCSTGYKLHTFQSGEAENIIKFLNQALEAANKSRKEAGSSKECPDSFSQEANGGNGIRSVDNCYGLEVGSMVEVPRYGVVRWIGNFPRAKGKLMAGLELEEEVSACSDGTLHEKRYFTCPAEKGFFVQLENCRPDSRFDQRPTEEKEQKGSDHRLEEQVTHLQAELREKERRENNPREKLREKEQREKDLRKQLHEMEQQLTNLRGQLEERNEQIRDFREQLQEKDEETANLQNQLKEKDQEMIELETTLSTAQDELRDYQRQQSPPDWVISRDHIQLTGNFLGKGGWGSVVEGKYCGCLVAVKQIHELILSPHNRKLFEREMDIASRCRHPCLLQFIGATNDEGNPLFVTELMETSLRTLLEQRALSEVEISPLSLDVARALSYLHQKQPSPIIHRDISSANVLLWRQGEQWRGKVSDYGTAKFMQQTMSVAPGAMIYSAPEVFTKNQTVKVDVYSFGVLLCEMCIRELPDPEKRVGQVTMVKNKSNRALIRRCLESEPEARPSIQEIIDGLEEPN